MQALNYKEYVTYRTEFDNLYDFYTHCQTRTNNNMKQSRRESRNDDTSNWFGTDTWEQAVEFAINGWQEGLDMVEHESDMLLTATGVGRRDYYPDVTGQILNVGAYCADRPDCWFRPELNEQVMQDGKIKRIAIGNSFLGNVNAENVRWRGAAIMATIDKLEAEGYRTVIDVLATSKAINRGNDRHVTRVRVKHAEDALNREKLAFAIINPSFFRRFVFSAREIIADHDKTFKSKFSIPNGMGSTVSAETVLTDADREKYDLIFPNKGWFRYSDFESSLAEVKDKLTEIDLEGLTIFE